MKWISKMVVIAALASCAAANAQPAGFEKIPRGEQVKRWTLTVAMNEPNQDIVATKLSMTVIHGLRSEMYCLEMGKQIAQAVHLAATHADLLLHDTKLPVYTCKEDVEVGR